MMVDGIPEYLRISGVVRDAMDAGIPVVALESTVIAHGLPHPANIAVAQAMEDAIRAEGCIPATIALLDGKIVVGLTAQEIETLGSTAGVLKASRRDIAVALATRRMAATTLQRRWRVQHLLASASLQPEVSVECTAVHHRRSIFQPI